MTDHNIAQLIYSSVFLLVNYLFFHLLKLSAKRTQKKYEIRKSRYFALRRLMSMLSVFIALGGLMFIWGLDLHNVWVTISSALAVVAIAFFATWSLIGNILAGVVLYFTSPFRIDDDIEVMPDEIRGQVIAINTFYTVVQDDDSNYINIPNSLFFQKYIRVKSTRSGKWPVRAPEKNN